MSARAKKKPSPPAPPVEPKRVEVVTQPDRAKLRIEELTRFRVQLRAEIADVKDRLESLEANLHAANGGIAELKRLQGSGDG